MRFFKTFLLTGCAAAMFLFVAPQPEVQADDYWNGYWNWYDSSYRPYYQRRHRRNYRNWDRYDRYRDGYRYDRNRDWDRYDGRGYSYDPYYGGGYYGYYRPYNSVQLGPLRFNWR